MSMQDKNYSSEDWDKLWLQLDDMKGAPQFHDESKMAETKHIKKKDFGIGAAMMANYQDPLQGLTAEIRAGAGHIEFAPSIQQGSGMHTFTKISAEKRRALKELKDINKVTLHTHAHAGVTGLTGFNEQNFSFEDRQRQQSIDEIKKAIDFAADVAEGGSITFHAGDFARPLVGQDWGNKAEFQMSPDEKDNMLLAVMDKETKRYAENGIFRTDQKVIVPVFKEGSYTDVEIHDKKYKIPELEEGQKVKSFDNFNKYAYDLLENSTEFKKLLNQHKDKIGGMDAETFFNKKIKTDDPSKKEVTNYYILELAAKKRFEDQQKLQLLDNINNISRNQNTVMGDLNEIERTIDLAARYAKNDDAYIYNDGRTVKAFRNKAAMEQWLKDHRISLDYIGEDSHIIKKNSTLQDIKNMKNLTFKTFYAGDVNASKFDDRKKELEMTKNNQLSAIQQQFDKLDDGKNNAYYTLSDFAQQQNKQSFAQLGVELYEKNKMLKKKNPKSDQMYFAIENLFPEKYGAHPEELLKVINQAKQGMQEGLKKQYNLDATQAKKIADQSIKATFDTGHLHMWKKYFKRKNKESEEDYNKRFNQWALDQAKKLVDAKVIGNVHIADNYGYDDDHVTAGQGTVPLKEYMEMFDKAKGEGKITGKFAVEGFDDSGERHGVHEAWKQSGVQAFRSQQATDAWVNLESDFGRPQQMYQRHESYLGNSQKPYFIFGKYSPDQEDWAPWDGLGME